MAKETIQHEIISSWGDDEWTWEQLRAEVEGEIEEWGVRPEDVRVEFESGYGDSSGHFKVYFARLETDQEEREREERRAGYERNREEEERATYERLKRKFEK